MPKNILIPRLRELSSRLTEAIEFGPLGSNVKWRKPYMGEHPDLPPGTAAFIPPSGVRKGGGQSPQARRAGAVLTSGKRLPDTLSHIHAKINGYPDAASMNEALKRHEIVHSIQAAKAGYKMPRTIPEIFKNEVGAYSAMNRNVKGGSKVLRASSGALGTAASTWLGALNNPRTKARMAAYGVGAAAITVPLLVNHGLKKREAQKNQTP